MKTYRVYAKLRLGFRWVSVEEIVETTSERPMRSCIAYLYKLYGEREIRVLKVIREPE